MPLLKGLLVIFLISAAEIDAADDAGERLYLSQCAYCHGPSGEGGRGSPLNRAQLLQAPDEEALIRVIRRGIADTPMPSSALTDEELRTLAGHVRKLGRAATASTPAGDPQNGERLYQAKGCAGCHSIGGRGGAFGPELSSIGERRSAAHLRESLVKPDSDISPGYFAITAITQDGRTITGVRINEDTFSIQLRDSGNRVHSLWKANLRVLRKDLKKSLMPGYGSALSSSELDDLVAWLSAEGSGR